MTDSASEKAQALAAYNQIVDKAEIGDIRLIGLNFDIKPAYYSGDDAGKRKAKFNCDIHDVSYDAESQVLGGIFEWTISVTEGRKKVLTVTAHYFAVYDDTPDVGFEHCEAFFKKVGRFATYPYFRGVVAQLSWASRADLPILPVLRQRS